MSEYVIGQTPTKELTDRLLKEHKCCKVRIIRYRSTYTLECRSDRLNIYLDINGKIEGIDVG